MLLCEYTFHPRDNVTIHALEDEVQGGQGSLSKNGQIWGYRRGRSDVRANSANEVSVISSPPMLELAAEAMAFAPSR